MAVAAKRAWAAPIRRTPLHPQWFALRGERRQRRWVARYARGFVLDIGSADGHARDWLPHCDYVSLDYPVTALGLYDTRPDVFADGAALPFREGTFDTVLLLDVLEHVRDSRQVLSEIARVLKPGGRLLLSVPFLYPLHDAPHDYRRFTAPGLVEAIERSGLVPHDICAQSPGFEAAALLMAISCAEAVIEGWRRRSWRLMFAPLLVLAIPLINATGWIAARMLGGGRLLAAGHSIDASKGKQLNDAHG